jgi:predicted NUDIX family NTP pyrophosphohydrolase
VNVTRLLRSRVGLGLALAADLLIAAGPSGPYEYSAASLEAAMALQERVTDDWLALDGVVGTAIGVDGRGHAVLKVYLEAPLVAAFPRFVVGVEIVPEVTGPFMTLGEMTAAGGDVAASARVAEAPNAEARGAVTREGEARDTEAVDPTRSFPRPVPIGVSTGHPAVSAGTIGARVTDGTRTFALSNNHIFAANNGGREGDNLLQPGVVDGGRDPDDAIGTLFDYEPLRFCRALACETNLIDAAVALTTPEDLDTSTPDGGYGAPRSWSEEAKLGMSVQKYGRTTGHTVGRVSGINATIDVRYRNGTARFEDQIVISGGGFSAGGDSGSLVVTKGVLLGDRRPVGLLFAGSPSTTLANPIDLVLDRFGVRVDGS